MMIWGEDDGVLPPAITEMWKQFYPHAEVHMVPRAGHFIQEDAPEEVVELIKEFLDKNS